MALREGFKPPETLQGWTRVSRHHRVTPRVLGQVETLKGITLTSKFNDDRRFWRLFFNKRGLIGFLMAGLSKLYRRRRERHNFRETLDTKILRILLKWKIEI